MIAPYDTSQVQAAIRLGWSMAEVRGRNRPDGPKGAIADVPPRDNYPLPLRIERTAVDLRIEAQVVTRILADQLDIDVTADGISLTDTIDHQARDLARLRTQATASDADVNAAWGKVAHSLWLLDAAIQNQLTSRSDIQACGYQLGRGLAETYWALDPASSEGWDSWTFLFDKARCNELTRLTGRMTAYLQPFSASAIAGSLEVWKSLALDGAWRRQPTVQTDLYAQTRTWYELLVMNKDPSADIRPYQLIRNWRPTLKAMIIFLPQMLLFGLGIGGVFLLVYFLSSNSSNHIREALAGVLAIFGLSAAGLSAGVKARAQAMGTRLRQDVYTDLIAVAITSAPAPPHRKHGRTRQDALETAVRKRTLTPTTPLK
jgi:hypothetical protein